MDCTFEEKSIGFVENIAFSGQKIAVSLSAKGYRQQVKIDWVAKGGLFCDSPKPDLLAKIDSLTKAA